jgi:hypothetical protein
MSKFNFKRILGRGLMLAVPIGIIAYVFLRFVRLFEKLAEPIAKKLGVERILGELTLTILAIVGILLLVFLLGLLMEMAFIAQVGKDMDALILRFFPSLNHFKLEAAEKLGVDDATQNWRPVLLHRANTLMPAYVIEETAEWVTLGLVKGYHTEPVDMLIIKRSEVSYQDISLKEMKSFSKQYGKGYISIASR